MKKIVQLLFLSLIIVLGACNKDEIHNTDTQVGRSRITNFAVFQFSGAKYVAVVQGSAYTEPGVKASEGGKDIPVKTTGSVNTSVPGLYVLSYSATNKDGYEANTTRNVVVIPGHEVPGADLSGKYDYIGSTVYQSTVTKVAEGTYTTDNCWSGGSVIPILFISLDGLTITIPQQPTGFGLMTPGTGSYNPATKRLIYKVSIPSQGINNSTRNWQKV
jgi:hypothetical protein